MDTTGLGIDAIDVTSDATQYSGAIALAGADGSRRRPTS